MAKKLIFPSQFYWGTATASYQIEGGWNEDGKGLSIWDTFSHTQGKIEDGSTGDIACDHYHRWLEDVKLMKEIGCNAYRFSISWPRVIPLGKGKINPPGLAFYDKLVDALLEANITPFITLYHWDLPQALQDEGGWARRDTAYYFADYASVVGNKLGDRVKHWITHNEPWVVAWIGYGWGVHAPGLKNERVAVQVAHHLLLSHGLAVEALRNACPEGEVGITLNLSPVHPASEKEEDKLAAMRHDGFLNRWFLDPIFRGHYPPDILELYSAYAPQVEPGDMAIISRRIDFLGVNYYSRSVMRFNPSAGPLQAEGVAPEGAEFTEMGWEIYPPGLYEILMRVQKDYQPKKLYITENGAAFADEIAPDGGVHDQKRVDYLRAHFAQAHRAIQDGAKLAGYFIWSLMDNFEWAHGFTKRFGIIYTDYPTQKRIMKDSALWYKEVISSNAVQIEG
ncbi:MAG: GH1 family beta-glucosidase [Candidatus Bathyarchaeia archaeon]